MLQHGAVMGTVVIALAMVCHNPTPSHGQTSEPLAFARPTIDCNQILSYGLHKRFERSLDLDLHTNMKRMTEETTHKSNSKSFDLGLMAIVYGVPVTADVGWSSESQDYFRRLATSEDTTDLKLSEKIFVGLLDKDIISAWSKCTTDGGTADVSFEPLPSGTNTDTFKIKNTLAVRNQSLTIKEIDAVNCAVVGLKPGNVIRWHDSKDIKISLKQKYNPATVRLVFSDYSEELVIPIEPSPLPFYSELNRAAKVSGPRVHPKGGSLKSITGGVMDFPTSGIKPYLDEFSVWSLNVRLSKPAGTVHTIHDNVSGVNVQWSGSKTFDDIISFFNGAHNKLSTPPSNIYPDLKMHSYDVPSSIIKNLDLYEISIDIPHNHGSGQMEFDEIDAAGFTYDFSWTPKFMNDIADPAGFVGDLNTSPIRTRLPILKISQNEVASNQVDMPPLTPVEELAIICGRAHALQVAGMQIPVDPLGAEFRREMELVADSIRIALRELNSTYTPPNYPSSANPKREDVTAEIADLKARLERIIADQEPANVKDALRQAVEHLNKAVRELK